MLTSKGQTRRDEILKVARQVLSETGYDSVTLRDVAGRLDIKLGNLQYYFATREDLFVALIEREGEQDLKTIRAHLAAQDDPGITFELVADALLQRWRGESAVVYLLMQVLRVHSPAFQDLCQRTYDQHYDAFSGLIARMRPDLDAQQTLRKAHIVTSLLDGALLQMVSSADEDRFHKDVVQEARALVRK